MKFSGTGKLWRWTGDKASWHFIGIPKDVSAEIKKVQHQRKQRRGFGAVKVTVTVGVTSWSTSIFPDSRSGTFLLPVKALVRKKEDIHDGEDVPFVLLLE